MWLEVREVSVTVGTNKKNILSNVSLYVASGNLVALVGPNGSGKTTLLRCIYGAIKPTGGSIILNGVQITEIPRRNLAKQIAVVLQELNTDLDFTVLDLVLMGRHPHKHLLEPYKEEDIRIARRALDKLNMRHFEKRIFTTLSGGEKQRVLIARAIAQQPGLVLMDEPTNHLDIRHSIEILELIKELSITTIAVIHDLNLAAAFCDFVYVMDQGRIVASGTPAGVFTPELIERVFRVKTCIYFDSVMRNRPIIVFLTGGQLKKDEPRECIRELDVCPMYHTTLR